MPERVPQRFKYRSYPAAPWKYGVCMPRESLWQIYAERGHGSFSDDPWDVLGHIIGDAANVEWLDNDFGWCGA